MTTTAAINRVVHSATILELYSHPALVGNGLALSLGLRWYGPGLEPQEPRTNRENAPTS